MTEYAVIAGKGNLPKLVIKELKNPKVICFEGEHDPEIKPDLVTGFGKVGQIINFLNQHSIRKIVFAGAMQRPDLKSLTPDGEGAKLFARLMAASFFGKSLGDDKLLSTITKFLEDKGFEVVGADAVMGNIRTPKATLTEIAPTDEQMNDIQTAFDALKQISSLDIGQAIVVESGIVLAVEAVEGTQRMVERAGQLKKSYGGVLVKCKKTGQEEKIDLPAIGADTVRQVVAAGLAGIAVEAGASILIEQDEIIKTANEAGVFVIGI